MSKCVLRVRAGGRCSRLSDVMTRCYVTSLPPPRHFTSGPPTSLSLSLVFIDFLLSRLLSPASRGGWHRKSRTETATSAAGGIRLRHHQPHQYSPLPLTSPSSSRSLHNDDGQRTAARHDAASSDNEANQYHSRRTNGRHAPGQTRR